MDLKKCERRDLNPWIPSKPDLKSGPFGQALVPSRLNTLVYLILESILSLTIPDHLLNPGYIYTSQHEHIQ